MEKGAGKDKVETGKQVLTVRDTILKRKVPFRFSCLQDIHLLRQVVENRPFGSSNAKLVWDFVASNLRLIGMNVDGRRCRERTRLLLEHFTEDFSNFSKKTGICERDNEIAEKEQLLREILDNGMQDVATSARRSVFAIAQLHNNPADKKPDTNNFTLEYVQSADNQQSCPTDESECEDDMEPPYKRASQTQTIIKDVENQNSELKMKCMEANLSLICDLHDKELEMKREKLKFERMRLQHEMARFELEKQQFQIEKQEREQRLKLELEERRILLDMLKECMKNMKT